MSKFKAGDKVHVEFDAVVVEGGINDGFWAKRPIGGTVLLADEWAEKILPILPTAEGSVIKVTRWANRKHDTWTAILRNGGGWAFSADRDLIYSSGNLRTAIASGSFDFEVLFDASKGADQ